jgi:hypothetical protein
MPTRAYCFFPTLLRAKAWAKLAALSCSLVILGLGCTPEPSEPAGEAVRLRVENLSPFILEEVLVEAGEGGGQATYRDIGPRQKSAYQDFRHTYRYAFIQVIVQQDTFRLQPLDYLGERRFQKGKFTLLLDFIGDPPLYLTTHFRED